MQFLSTRRAPAPQPPPRSPQLDELARRVNPMVIADQAQHLQRNALHHALGQAVVAVMAVITLRDGAPETSLLVWLGLQLAAVLLHVAVVAYQQRHGTAPGRQLHSATALAGLSGLLWMAGVLLVFPGSDYAHRALLMVLLGGLATGAMFALNMHLPALCALYLPVVAGVVIAALSNGGPARWPVAVLTLVWLVLALVSARRLHLSLIDSLRNRHAATLLAADLQAQKDVAVALGQSRTRFLAAASHDLRQPVHALSLMVSALQQEPPPDEARRLLGHVRNTVDGMGAMFNALLDISKLDADLVQPQFSRVLLQPLLARIANDEGAIARDKGLVLDCRVQGPADLAVHTDPQLLERVLRNLLSNAVRYTRQGRVALLADVRGSALRLRVADTGIGIPQALRAEVFQEFVQLHNPERDRDQGLGLGLSIVQRLCALLNLPLRLHSRPGRGTVFTLQLPLAGAPVPAKAPSAAAPAPGQPALPALQTGDVVLVIDDAADIRVAMAALLGGWGCQVLAAANLAQLLPQLMPLTTTPRLILCDLRLQGPDDGLAVIDQLRSGFNDDLPAILVTGDTGPDRLRDAAASGLGLLHKPVTEAALRAAIGQALQSAPTAD